MNIRFPKSILRRCSYMNYNINEGLMRRSNNEGFALPSYQRGDVWTLEQKIKFIESLVMKIPVGAYCVHTDDEDNQWKWELLDGQQRWTAIFNYVDNVFPVFGLYYRDLTEVELRYFKFIEFPVFMASGFTEEEKEELFNRLAYGGTPNCVDDEKTKRDLLI